MDEDWSRKRENRGKELEWYMAAIRVLCVQITLTNSTYIHEIGRMWHNRNFCLTVPTEKHV